MKAIVLLVLGCLLASGLACGSAVAPTYLRVWLEVKRDDTVVAKPTALVVLGMPAQITITDPISADGA